MDATTLKNLGNAALHEQKWNEALDYYTQGLALDSKSEAAAALLSNRSLCYIRLGQYDLGAFDGGVVGKGRS